MHCKNGHHNVIGLSRLTWPSETRSICEAIGLVEVEVNRQNVSATQAFFSTTAEEGLRGQNVLSTPCFSSTTCGNEPLSYHGLLQLAQEHRAWTEAVLHSQWIQMYQYIGKLYEWNNELSAGNIQRNGLLIIILVLVLIVVVVVVVLKCIVCRAHQGLIGPCSTVK